MKQQEKQIWNGAASLRQQSQPFDGEKVYDACIIGGGVIGCAIARELSRWQLSLGWLEAKSDVAEGTSKANSAIVHSGYDAKPGSVKARTNVAGNQLFETLCHDLHVPFRRNTSLVVAFTPDGLTGLRELKSRGEINGVPGLSILSQAELRQREPAISPAATGALLAPTGGICSPYELTIALAAQAVLNGLDLQLNCRVGQVSRDASGFHLQTSRGPVRCKILINAAGVYADTIHNQLSQKSIKITPRRGEYWLLDQSLSDTFSATIFQLPTAMGKGILVSPTVDGTLLLGPTAEDIEEKEDVRTTAQRLDDILRIAAITWPDLPRNQFITSFAGLRAHADQGDFVLGEAADCPGLIEAIGIESPGLTAAPAIGIELARLAAKRLHVPRRSHWQPAWQPPQPFRLMTSQTRAQAVAANPFWGRIVCRCEQVTEAEIRAAINLPVGATTVDGIKRRTRAGMGRCQASFCTPRVLAILSEELGISRLELTKFGGGSRILTGRIGSTVSQPPEHAVAAASVKKEVPHA